MISLCKYWPEPYQKYIECKGSYLGGTLIFFTKGNFEFGSYDEINPTMLKMSAEFIVNLLGGGGGGGGGEGP